MRVAICDDRKEDALYLKSLLNEKHETVIYVQAVRLLNDVGKKKEHYDLYLIDIYMDGVNGIELARQLRQWEEEAVICFISSSDAFYREAYDLYAVQYLLKPVKKEDVEQLLVRVSQYIKRQREQSLQFRRRGEIGTVPYRNILFISSREHTLSIYCKDGNVQQCKGKLSEMALQICGDVFLRCHQSFIVNMYYVSRLSGNELLVYGHCIPISRRYLMEVKRRYQEILFEELD